MAGKKQNDSSIVQDKGVGSKQNTFEGKIQYLPLNQLADFKNHPFKVEMNTELFELIIMNQGNGSCRMISSKCVQMKCLHGR